MNAIIGHRQILEFFDKVIKNGNLSHAYCFVGPEKVGKRTVAEYLASRIFQVDFSKLKILPDYVVVEQLFDDKTGKTKKDISVEQMRQLREGLSRHTFLGDYKIALVDQADKMNIEAANALLKTLEEPTKKTIIFLLTDDEERLPRTILSRCQRIYFYPVDRWLIAEELKNREVNEEKAEKLARWSRGLPGLAISWSQDPEEWEKYQQEVKRFVSLLKRNFFEKNKIVEDLFGDKTDHIATRENLQHTLNLWQLLVRDIFFNAVDEKNYNIHQIEEVGLPIDKIVKLEDKMREARDLLDKNIHPRLLIEQILLELP